MTSSSSVLIVDDERAVRDLMSRWVTALGLHAATATNADEALATLRAGRYDLAVVDGLMPGHDGQWLATELQREHPSTSVIIATAYSALLGEPPQSEIADLLVKPFQREGFAVALERGRQWRKQALEELQWHAALSTELRERTEDLCVRLHASADQSSAIIYQLTAVMAERVPATLQHGARVARFAVATARELSLDQTAIDELDLAARFHDVGKAAMPWALLAKPSPLAPGETAIMRRHVDAGAEILRRTPALASIAPIVLTTHEWFGGGGYPLKLAGAAIPLASRIIGVIDAYDTMTDPGRDRASVEPAGAVSELLRCGGTQFDPEALDAFLAVLGRH
jgi:response regulator RpfG family c-di-GMP phosphodiesterase